MGTVIRPARFHRKLKSFQKLKRFLHFRNDDCFALRNAMGNLWNSK